MNDPNKKVNPKETPKDEKIQLTDSEAEKAVGAKFDRVERPTSFSSKTPRIKNG